MQVSSIGSLLETSEIVSLIFTLTFSAVIIKVGNFWRRIMHILSTEMEVERVCCDYEGDEVRCLSKKVKTTRAPISCVRHYYISFLTLQYTICFIIN